MIERALERAGESAAETPDPLLAEGQAGHLASSFLTRPHGPEVIVFMSLSVSRGELAGMEPGGGAGRRRRSCCAASCSQGLKATVKRIGTFLARGAGAAIDPRLFRLFGITAIPAVAVVPGGVPPCVSRGCAEDAAPPHDRVIGGNIGLEAALSIIAEEGGPGRETLRDRHLAKLRGDSPVKRKLWMRVVVPTLLLLTHLNIVNARAEDPKAVARAIGDAGRATAAAVARDPEFRPPAFRVMQERTRPKEASAPPIWNPQRTGS